jgi:hypothetical protein
MVLKVVEVAKEWHHYSDLQPAKCRPTKTSSPQVTVQVLSQENTNLAEQSLHLRRADNRVNLAKLAKLRVIQASNANR